MSLQKRIPDDVKDMLADDSYMLICALNSAECKGRIEWHHAETYAGTRRDDWWCIIPLCGEFHHPRAGYSEFSELIREAVAERKLIATR
jgi:hypothetical protein